MVISQGIRKAAVAASLALMGGLAATPVNAATPAQNLESIVRNEIVVGSGVNHAAIWPGSEGYVDRQDGQKRYFVFGNGASHHPNESLDAKVSMYAAPGKGVEGVGTAAQVGLRNPVGGNIMITTSSDAPAWMQVNPDNQGAWLATFADTGRAPDKDTLDDYRFIGREIGVRANGMPTKSYIEPGKTLNSKGWDVYKLHSFVGTKKVDFTVAIDTARQHSDLIVLNDTLGTQQMQIGYRNHQDRNQLVGDYSVIHATSGWQPSMRTDLDLTQLGACSDGLYNICLNNGRFNVTIDWTTPFGNSGPAKMHRISPDAAYGTFFNDNNAEVFIKVLDACSFNPYNDFWVFSTHLSNVEYTITVTDTQTNQVRTTFNPQGYIAPAILATNTIFTECGSGDGSGLPPSEFLDTRSLPPNANPIVEEYIDPSVIGACIPDQNTMCLNNGRFRVHATFENFQGGGGDAKQWQLTNESGYSTFFNDSNVELFFKVHPACVDPWNNSWVFAGGLTNVPVEFYVEDTAFGKVYHVTNPSGRPFSTVLDTDTIFTDCPVNSTGNASSPLMSGLEQIAAPATGGTALTNHRVALHEVYNRLDVDTPAGTARSGHVVSHVGLDQKVGGAVLVSARNEENVADATPYFNGDVREMILLREIPTTGSQTAYALLTDPYVSQGVVNASTDVVTTTLGNATVSNSAGAAPKYAIGSTGDGVFGPALRGFSYSGISVTPEEANKMSLVPHVINTLYCNVANDCENQSGAIVSPMANAAVTRVEGLFGGPNQYMKWEQTDTNGMQGNANIHSTEWHAEPGNLIGMSYLPVREGPRLYGIGTSLNGDSGVIQPPPDGNTVTSYPSMEVPLDWRTPIQPFD